MAGDKSENEAKMIVGKIAENVLRLQELGFAAPDSNALGHSGGGGNCCFSGASTGGCKPTTTIEKVASPTDG